MDMTPKRKPGRPRNQELDKLQKDLAISRRHARNLLNERKSGSPTSEKPSPLAEARLTKTLREISVLEMKLETLRLEKREMEGELLFLEEAVAINGAAHQAIKNALAHLAKNLAPRIHNQSQRAIEKTLAEFADNVCAMAEAAIARCKTPHEL
jgi:chromosome segregation ATPase